MRVPSLVIDHLMAQPEIGFAELCLYVLAFGYRPESVAGLAKLAKMSRAHASQACRNLVALGWMALRGTTRKLRPVPLIPHPCQEQLARLLEEEYNMAPNRGEFLMKKYLDLLICSEDYVDNARPRFLQNPRTTKPLEYDRYYRQKVAFEFNGPQHDGVTEAFPEEKELQEAQARDLLKNALSERAGVKLVVIAASDLDPRILNSLIPAELPRNQIEEHGPYHKTIARISEAYRAKSARCQALRTKGGNPK